MRVVCRKDTKLIWSWPKALGIYSTSCCQAILNVIKDREREKRSTMHKKQCSSCFELSIINAQILATRRMIHTTHVKWKVSIHYYSGCVLSNLGHSYNLTEARNLGISKNGRGVF